MYLSFHIALIIHELFMRCETISHFKNTIKIYFIVNFDGCLTIRGHIVPILCPISNSELIILVEFIIFYTAFYTYNTLYFYFNEFVLKSLKYSDTFLYNKVS